MREFQVHSSRINKSSGVKLCRARLLFVKGRFADSVPLYEAEKPLADDDPVTLELAWARYYAGDRQGALRDLTRYRAARREVDDGNWNDADAGSEILLFRRMGEVLPDELAGFIAEMPDGPWPRPLLAMEAGLISPDALKKIVEAYTGDARELALDDAWYGIGQRALTEHDTSAAAVAFHWYNGNGIRSSGNSLRARVELARMQPTDANAERAARAAEQGDYKTANALWRISADAGLASAQDNLAQSYHEGLGVAVDYPVAMHWARLAAEQGVPHAQNLVGVMYARGQGIPVDQQAAVQWYEKAAANGDLYAMDNLGIRYRDGQAVKQDDTLAEHYFLLAAERGKVESQLQLAELYSRPGSQKIADAIVWSRRAAHQGNLDAQAMLGAFYLEGEGMPANSEYGLALLREAAGKGNARAQSELGWAYSRGTGVVKDDRAAIAWLEKAVAQGEGSASILLATYYYHGHAVPSDPEKAYGLILEPAMQGNEVAEGLLGLMYANGRGVRSNPEQAEIYLRRAAEKGNVDSQVKLGHMLYFGQGIPKNPVEARAWYEKASARGADEATNNLGDIYEKGAGVPQDLARALNLYRQAANNGHRFAFISLASLYQHGTGVPRDPFVAYTCLAIGAQSFPEEAKAPRIEIGRELTEEQRKEAEAAAAAWKKGMPLPGDKAQ